MVVVAIDGREYTVPARVADVIRKVIEHADRIADGTKILRLAMRKEKITASVEEEL